MKILNIRPAPPGSPTLARFDLELNQHIRLFNLALRQRPGDLTWTVAPNAFGPPRSANNSIVQFQTSHLLRSWSFQPMPTATTNIRSIARALAGQVAGRESVLVPGPGHSRKDRSLKVKFKADGTFTVTSFAGDDWRTCKDFIREKLGLAKDWHREAANDDTPVIRLSERDDDESSRIRSALKRWETSGPIAGTLAETYLASRGLAYQGDAICFRANDRSLVALITDAVSNEPCGVHVTYLDREGHKTGRKMYGRAKGAVVRLSADTDVHYGLGVGEGIETCLATSFKPIWACLSAGTLAAFPVLDGIDALTVFADNDASGTGLAAGKACAERWHAQSREVFLTIPTETGVDFATQKEVA
jgi:hypothetical protein